MNKDLRQQTSSSQSLPPTSQRVFVCAINSKDNEWYSFPLNFSDLDGNRKRERGIGRDDSQILTTLGSKTDSLFSGFAVVDSTIYCIGGQPADRNPTWKFYHYVYNDVYSLNTSSHVRKTWETSPLMHGARSFPQVVTLNGMIYVMGAVGSEDGGPEPWAEVFDPKSGSWSPLDPPDPKPSIDCPITEAFCAALPHTNQVLVGSTLDTFICLYDVGSNSWKHLKDIEILSPPSSFECPPVVSGKSLFWFRNGLLNAYDLELNLNYSAVIEGLEDFVPPYVFELGSSGYPSPKLLCHADKDFCLACFEYSMSEKDLVLLHCIRFSVSSVAASGEETCFHASVRAYKSYYFKMSYPLRDARMIYESMKLE